MIHIFPNSCSKWGWSAFAREKGERWGPQLSVSALWLSLKLRASTWGFLWWNRVNAMWKQVTKTQFKRGSSCILILTWETRQRLLPAAELPRDRPARLVSGSAVGPVSGLHIHALVIFNTLVEFPFVHSTPNPYENPPLTLSPGPL